nr:30S ribosomal protein S16 [Mycoplasmopsis primatum]
MVKIRLKRLGSKFNACYKIVVADARAPRDGRFIEAIGEYNPHSKAFKINEEATIQWIKNGAQLTQTVYNLFRTHKLNEKINAALKSNTKSVQTKKEVSKPAKTVASKKSTSAKTTSTKKTAAKKASTK